MARNLCLADTWTIEKFNDTLRTSFVKHDIYQKIQYIHNQGIYKIPTHLARDFGILDELITLLMHAADKNTAEKYQAVLNGHRNTRKRWN